MGVCRGGPMRASWTTLGLVLCQLGFLAAATTRAEDSLFQLREEVRTEDPSSPRQESDNDDRRESSYDPTCDPCSPDYCSGDAEAWSAAAWVAGVVASACFWGPPMVVGDSRHVDG